MPALQGVLLDQYGVLHDGKKAYPGAIAAVEALAAAGRKLLVLSNSSRREAPSQTAAPGVICQLCYEHRMSCFCRPAKTRPGLAEALVHQPLNLVELWVRHDELSMRHDVPSETG